MLRLFCPNSVDLAESILFPVSWPLSEWLKVKLRIKCEFNLKSRSTILAFQRFSFYSNSFQSLKGLQFRVSVKTSKDNRRWESNETCRLRSLLHRKWSQKLSRHMHACFSPIAPDRRRIWLINLRDLVKLFVVQSILAMPFEGPKSAIWSLLRSLIKGGQFDRSISIQTKWFVGADHRQYHWFG